MRFTRKHGFVVQEVQVGSDRVGLWPDGFKLHRSQMSVFTNKNSQSRFIFVLPSQPEMCEKWVTGRTWVPPYPLANEE